MGEAFRNKGTAMMAARLQRQDYMLCEPGYDSETNKPKKRYTIGPKGIDAVMNYVKYIQKEAFR